MSSRSRVPEIGQGKIAAATKAFDWAATLQLPILMTIDYDNISTPGLSQACSLRTPLLNVFLFTLFLHIHMLLMHIHIYSFCACAYAYMDICRR